MAASAASAPTPLPASPSAPIEPVAAAPSDGAKHATERPRRSARHSKLIIPVLSTGLVIAGAAMIVREFAHQPHTASAVTRDLRDLALTRSLKAGQPDGGELGPWWISAAAFDPLSGELKNFRLKSGPIELAAATARIVVDAEEDSIAFDLWRVVYTVLPNSTHPDQVGEIIELESCTLGPVPYGHEIVQDAGSYSSPPAVPRNRPMAGPPIAGVTE